MRARLRLCQTGKILGIFQIEIGIGGKPSSQRRFSALPWAKNRRDGKDGHELGYCGPIRFSVNKVHGRILNDLS